MSMPVKLSDALVLKARLAGATMERSIAGQVEYWARLGQAIEPVLTGDEIAAVSRGVRAPGVGMSIPAPNSEAGQERLRAHLHALPFPHYEPHPEISGALIRTDADGHRTVGRFVRRQFVPSTDG